MESRVIFFVYTYLGIIIHSQTESNYRLLRSWNLTIVCFFFEWRTSDFTKAKASKVQWPG